MCVGVDVVLLVTVQLVSSSNWWTVVRASHMVGTTTSSGLKLYPNAYYMPGT